MEMSKKQAEFWVALIVLCTIFAVAILLVDFGIKSAILEESNRLRIKIEDWERANGRKSAGTNEVGNANDASDNYPLPSDVLVVDTSRLEAGNGDARNTTKARNTSTNGAKSSRPARNRTIPNGDK